ncbi:DUF3578 domain-containing protein [Pseudodesulfovibrio sp. zrk46]|uniref:MrcB family domain-containing protein n=1 Tax=Pseudodesulfovibrio sp. zrk46 TaxID=2725288 RepID=UPI001448F2F3|nr:DUF3578 domain-containing protein [Pseudodesulfovibrio sp. zrk46]QJB56500.1 DUF3578 domain-containing protein [Pseudodesulfovibrio sp. zrk46]
MSLREELIRISQIYPQYQNQPIETGFAPAKEMRELSGNIFPDLIRNDVGYHFRGSPTLNKWPRLPWLGIFHPTMEKKASVGLYVVFSFSEDMERVYLILTQGVTKLFDELGAAANPLLKQRANYLQNKIGNTKAAFNTSESTQDAGNKYINSSILWRSYDIVELPSEKKLTQDLNDILDIYTNIVPAFHDLITNGFPQNVRQKDKKKYLEKRAKATHRTYEGRNRPIVKEVKRQLKAKCRACGIDFSKIYGKFGKGYIEAHHLVPYSSYNENEGVSVTVDDFTVLCPNCHRMVHKLYKDNKAVPLTPELLKNNMHAGALDKLNRIFTNFKKIKV